MQAPDWQAPDMFIYPASMTAVIRMSDYIRPDITPADRLAAFIGQECRGIAQQVENAQGEVFLSDSGERRASRNGKSGVPVLQ